MAVAPYGTPSLAIFLPASGDWNTPANWSTAAVPLPNQSPDILNGSTATVDGSAGACGTIYVGQGGETPTGTLLFRPGAALAAQNLLLGRDGKNFGQFNQSGGVLTVERLRQRRRCCGGREPARAGN